MNSKSSDPEELAASTMAYSRVKAEVATAHFLALTILTHPDLSRVGERTALPALTSGRPVRLSRSEPTFAAPGGGAERPLSDPHLSRSPLRLSGVDGLTIERGEVGMEIEVDGMELAERRQLLAEELRQGVVLALAGRVVLLLHHLKPAPPNRKPRFGLVGESDAMAHLRRQIHRSASHTAPVLLRGETGTGKELVARAIHQSGPRAAKTYVTVNLGAVPPSLAAAELFGATRGAFTGANNERQGFFRRAHGGTLFLDEVGDTPSEVQPLLLRALESGEIQPVGAAHTQEVDVRLIAATDATLEQAIAEGRFRAPLLHRLAGFEIHLPPLRTRRDDIGRLLIHFLRLELEKLGKPQLLEPVGPRQRPWLPASAMVRLVRFNWPGNVRQLRNAARQIAIAACEAEPSDVLAVVDEFLKEEVSMPALQASIEDLPKPGHAAKPPTSYRQPYEISDDELLAALQMHGFRLKPAAAQLGVSRGSLYKLIDGCPQIRRATEIGHEELEACSERHGGNLDLMAAELEISRYGLQQRLRELQIGV